MSERTLTVSKLFRPLRWKTQFVPFLRIAGNWFAMAGFHPGDKVTVRVENGALIIEPFVEDYAARRAEVRSVTNRLDFMRENIPALEVAR